MRETKREDLLGGFPYEQLFIFYFNQLKKEEMFLYIQKIP